MPAVLFAPLAFINWAQAACASVQMELLYLAFFLALASAQGPPPEAEEKGKNVLEIKSVTVCDGYNVEDFKWAGDDLAVQRFNKTQYIIKVNANLKIDIPGGLKLTIMGERQDGDNAQSRKKMFDFTEDFCTYLEEHEEELRPIGLAFTPPVSACPLPADVYSALELSLSIQPLEQFLGEGTWLIGIKAQVEDDVYFCYVLEILSQRET